MRLAARSVELAVGSELAAAASSCSELAASSSRLEARSSQFTAIATRHSQGAALLSHLVAHSSQLAALYPQVAAQHSAISSRHSARGSQLLQHVACGFLLAPHSLQVSSRLSDLTSSASTISARGGQLSQVELSAFSSQFAACRSALMTEDGATSIDVKPIW